MRTSWFVHQTYSIPFKSFPNTSCHCCCTSNKCYCSCCLLPLKHVLRRSRRFQTAWGYLGLDDGLGAGLQHGEVVGEHKELQLLCLQHHLNVVLHSSCLATHTHTHRYRNRHRWKRATESITSLVDHTRRNRPDQWRSQLITAASFLCDRFSIECQRFRL